MHPPPPLCSSWRDGGVRSTCYGSSDRSTIVALKVGEPLTVALNGDAIVFPYATVLELDMEISRSDTRRRYTLRHWRACSQWRTSVCRHA
jgi:hypothetical protein